MADRSIDQEVVQVGFEAPTALGSKVAATALLSALMVDIGTEVEFDTIASSGQEFDSGVALRQEWASGSLEGTPTYTELMYVLTNKFGQPATTNLGGSPVAYRHLWTRNGSSWPTPRPWTVERGVVNSPDPIDVATYFLINNLTLDFSRTAAQAIGGSAIARAFDVSSFYFTGNAKYTLTSAAGPPTAGTFTLTVGTPTTGIAFGATPAAVQTALEALPAVGAGNVRVTLTTLGPTLATANSVYTVEFIGALAQTAVTMTGTFTGLTPASSIALASAGAGAALPALDNIPILAGQVAVYVDALPANIGTTKYLRPFVYHYESGEQLDMFWPLNPSLPSFGGHTLGKATDAGVTLTLGNDPTGRDFYRKMRISESNFVRLEATGPTISGANAYRLRIDAHGQVYGAPGRGDQNRLSTLELPLHIVRHNTWGKAMEVELITSVPAAA